MQIYFISYENLKKAFINGVDSFLELHKIQSNQNYVSSTMSHMFQIGRSVHTVEITNLEVEKANRVKAAIKRCPDEEELKVILKSFGNRLLEIAREKNKRCYLTTYYSFISLSIFHYATVSSDSNRFIKDGSIQPIYNVELLLKYYLTPDTRHKTIMLELFDLLGKALINAGEDNVGNSNLMLDSTTTTLDIDDATDTDKLGALLASICEQNNNFQQKARLFLGDDMFNKYSSLAKKFKEGFHNGKFEKYDEETNDPVSLMKKQSVEACYNKVKMVLQAINNMSEGLVAYALKFEQRTSSPRAGSQALNFIKGNAKTYGYGVGETQLANQLTGIITTQALQTAFPPAVITSLASGIVSTLVDVCFESKGYGVKNRHGITGQIRAFLLKNYLSQLAIYIKNQYYYFFQLCIENDDSFESHKNIILNTIKSFEDAYKKAIGKLPNHTKKGSLYFYLNMYANPDKQFEPDIDAINKWNRDKLSWVKDDE